MFSGQAAVAVIISLFQLLSAVESLRGSSGLATIMERSTVDRATSIFFFVMAAGMVIAILSHTYLTRMTIYKEATAEFEGKPIISATEETPLLQTRPEVSGQTHPPAHRILRVRSTASSK